MLIKATPHNHRLTPLHVINLHIFSINEVYAVILTQSFLAGRQPAVVNFMQSDEKSDGVSDAQ